MREKIRDFIYLNTKRYVSLTNLKLFYFASLIIPFIMTVAGIAAIKTNGISSRSLFPLVAIGVWSLLYWIFVLVLQSKRVKKTFELRFLVNGIFGLLLSSLFWTVYTTINLFSDEPLFEDVFSLWVLLFYLLFSVIYVAVIVCGVHKGAYKKIKEKSQMPKAIAISAFFSSLLPIAGVSGMLTARILREHASDEIQDTTGVICFILLIFIPALAHINFVQYFYCKKYNIFCDEYGNTTSPNLEPQIKVKQIKTKKKTSKKTENSDNSLSNKKIPLLIKILIGIVSVPIIFFVIVFIAFFIKVMIERM